jgi:uridine kinase
VTGSPLSALVEALEACVAPAGVATRIVGIDGHGGSGKTSLAARLARDLDATVVHTDDFAGWDNPIDWWPSLIEQVLDPLAAGKTPVPAGGIVLLEGVTATRAAFRPYLAFTIWVETPRDICLARGLARDGEDALEQWERWLNDEDRYIAREQPAAHADVVIRGDRDLWT